eukprot:gene10285-biopygen8448
MFAHLNGIWFSDVSQEDNLEIHAILRVRHTIKGNNNKPMAEETISGWTLMETIQDQQSNDQHTVANLTIEQPKSVNEEFKQLHDLDFLGIKDGSNFRKIQRQHGERQGW